MSRNTVARIDIAALRHNLSVVRRMVGSSEIACVVKADAYGHGIERVARALDEADLLAVATVGEVASLRNAGWQGRVLLLEGFAGAEGFDQAQQLQAELVVHHEAQLQLLRQRSTRGLGVWLKLNTGMHRLGFPASEAGELFAALSAMGLDRRPTLMSHFACADDPSNPMTIEQMRRFDDAVQGLDAPQSLANSAAVLNFPDSYRDVVRPGIMLYGISPVPGRQGTDHDLRPVMTLACQLLAINDCKAGDAVGYGARYRCPRDMRIGVAGIGYGDGYPREMPDGAPLLVNGRRASLAGAVSMDLVTIDLSGHDEARVGDPVTLWGGDLPVEEVAQSLGAIAYTLVCGVTARVRRQSA